MKKLWGGRFQSETSNIMEDFNSSIGFDWKLYHYDIEGSKAHVKMLDETGIISREEAGLIIGGLEAIEADIDQGLVEFTSKHEDIHMNIEALLIEKIGQVGKKIHTARSRNDQIALDFKFYVLKKNLEISSLISFFLKFMVASSTRSHFVSATIKDFTPRRFKISRCSKL